MPELRREAPRNKPGQALLCRGDTFFLTSTFFSFLHSVSWSRGGHWGSCSGSRGIPGFFSVEPSFLLAQGIVKWPAVEDMADNDVGVVRVQFNDEWIVRFHVRMFRAGTLFALAFFCCVCPVPVPRRRRCSRTGWSSRGGGQECKVGVDGVPFLPSGLTRQRATGENPAGAEPHSRVALLLGRVS